MPISRQKRGQASGFGSLIKIVIRNMDSDAENIDLEFQRLKNHSNCLPNSIQEENKFYNENCFCTHIL